MFQCSQFSQLLVFHNLLCHLSSYFTVGSILKLLPSPGSVLPKNKNRLDQSGALFKSLLMCSLLNTQDIQAPIAHLRNIVLFSLQFKLYQVILTYHCTEHNKPIHLYSVWFSISLFGFFWYYCDTNNHPYIFYFS